MNIFYCAEEGQKRLKKKLAWKRKVNIFTGKRYITYNTVNSNNYKTEPILILSKSFHFLVLGTKVEGHIEWPTYYCMGPHIILVYNRNENICKNSGLNMSKLE